MTATVLVLVETVNDYLPILEKQGYHLELAPTPAERKTAIFEHGERFSAVLTRGPLGLTEEEIAALPNLKNHLRDRCRLRTSRPAGRAPSGHRGHQRRRGQRVVGG
nr:hypothetical protein GCM10020185_68930 [Pseudomonas brassicacearum subsp. brassicacearum]